VGTVSLRPAGSATDGGPGRRFDRRDRVARSRDIYDSQTPYCASKAGLQMLAMGMAWEWGPLGVRTNVVQPGWIETALNREYLSSGPDVRERVIKQDPAPPHGPTRRRRTGGALAVFRRRRLRQWRDDSGRWRATCRTADGGIEAIRMGETMSSAASVVTRNPGGIRGSGLADVAAGPSCRRARRKPVGSCLLELSFHEEACRIVFKWRLGLPGPCVSGTHR